MIRRSLLRVLAASVAALVVGSTVPADAYPPYDLTIINDTNSTMVSFYATSTRWDGWGDDLFGYDTLEPGEQWKRNLADGYGTCVFDLKAVFADGDEVERRAFNVCNATYWRIYNRRR